MVGQAMRAGSVPSTAPKSRRGTIATETHAATSGCTSHVDGSVQSRRSGGSSEKRRSRCVEPQWVPKSLTLSHGTDPETYGFLQNIQTTSAGQYSLAPSPQPRERQEAATRPTVWKAAKAGGKTSLPGAERTYQALRRSWHDRSHERSYSYSPCSHRHMGDLQVARHRVGL
jgi:hypothetical protein